MQDRQLYQQILGLSAPWIVDRVELKLDKDEVHIHLTHEVAVQSLLAKAQASNRDFPESWQTGAAARGPVC